MAKSSAPSVRALVRFLGTTALLASGGVHLDLYLTGYHSIPTIGPLFLVQTGATIVLGLVLLIRVGQTRSSQLLSAAGALLAAGTLGGYLLSRAVGLFGFHEVATTAGLVAGLLETVAFVALGYFATSSGSGALLAPLETDRVDAFLSSRMASLAVALIGAAGLALVLVSGVGVNDKTAPPSDTSPSATGTLTIVINNFTFVPAQVTVHPGQRILVHNEDQVAHTLTAVPGSTPFGNFNTGDIEANQTKSFNAPTKSGSFQYFCSIHNFMTGVITVKS